MNARTTVAIAFSFILVITTSCNRDYKYTGSLPTKPENLSEFNTVYDDYNSTAPSLGYLIPFCFSTNRNSFGGRFDLIFRPMDVNFDKSSGELVISDDYGAWQSIAADYQPIDFAVGKTRTSGDEFGPNLMIDRSLNELYFTMLYSTDATGDAQINFVSNLSDPSFSEPREVSFLNSTFDDQYPTFNSDRSEIYFCSNRDGDKFNFYKTAIDKLTDLETLLSDTSHYDIVLDDFLSSTSNDKCPFIFENTMVFASDRAGGFGGYDLYYSKLEGGEWTAPINFGADINSDADEFRPIFIDEGVTPNQTMMVFSSNRAGGQGGFDLYFVGVSI